MSVEHQERPLSGRIIREIERSATEILSGVTRTHPSRKPYRGYEKLHYFTPGQKHSAVYLAGERLRHFPNEPVLNEPISPQRRQPDDVIDQTLVSMVNASIERPIIDPSVPAFECLDPLAEDVCNVSETHFLRAIGSLHGQCEKKADIITDGNDRPIILRKRMGARTCLTLCDVTINGIPYPAGSITSLEFNDDVNGEVEDSVEKRQLRVLGLESVASLGFQRLSRFVLPRKYQKAWESYGNDFLDTSHHEHMIMRGLTPTNIAQELKDLIAK